MYINIWTHPTYPGTVYNVVCQTFHHPYLTYPHLKPPTRSHPTEKSVSSPGLPKATSSQKNRYIVYV